jgi:hypothetical protein
MYRLYRYKQNAEKRLVRELIGQRERLAEIEALSLDYATQHGGEKPPGRYQIEHVPSRKPEPRS